MSSEDLERFFADRMTMHEQDSNRKDTEDTLSHLRSGEAHNDFYGLPSDPISIYHTGPPWPLPTGAQAQRIPKEARPVCNHEIAAVWHELGEEIYKYFDSIELKWTSMDPVRFAKQGEEPGPLFIWVGVLPETLSPDEAKVAAEHCKKILEEHGITDVEIAFRVSVFTRSTKLEFLDLAPSIDTTLDIRGPFTATLGIQIAPKAFPYFEGTGCLYLCEGGESDRTFLLTARHVVLPPSEYPNDLYHRKNNRIPRRDVIHLGYRAYQNVLKAITCKIEHEVYMADFYKREIGKLGVAISGEDSSVTTMRGALEAKLAEAEMLKEGVNEFHDDIAMSWNPGSRRVLGHVLYAPPISVSTGNKRFTQDWALVEFNRGKFNQKTFRGNVIRLGNKYTHGEFMDKMYPDPETRAEFEYPDGGLIQLRDFVKDGELRSPTMPDKDGEECFIVVKNGAGTGLTFGRASGIESFVRDYKNYAAQSTSMEIAIYPYGHKGGAFSAPGDSGSVIGDANNRIVGMINGGAGLDDFTDVTYASPYYFIDECVKEVFPSSYLYPIPA